MNQVVVLEWTFAPADYFEQTIEVRRDDYILRIESGKAEAKVNPSAYDANPNYRLALHEALNHRFLAVQVLTHQSYDLSAPSMYRLHPDGRKDKTMFADTGYYKTTGFDVDFLVKDKDGNALTDTKKDRIEKKEYIANLAEKYHNTDKTLDALLNSYAAAVRDPDNELVHLYEIQEAVTAKFGGEMAARAALDVSKTKWSRFGKLANNEPLKQGRHRGKKVGTLRDATEGELNEARSIARLIVESYLTWLNNNG
jgi:hypothetical protein